MSTPSSATIDDTFMERALFLAERGRGRTAPNPIVGAVVVSPDGVVVGQGAHLEAGGPHAEVHALEAAGDRASGATLYVTLEPCSHAGRTGPCVERITAAGIARVVYATADPNPRVSGQGGDYLRAHGVAVTTDVGRAEALRQHAPFFTWVTARRPFVTLKMAMSSDGFAGRPDRRVTLTGPAADRWTHRQRAEVDAIAVGSETVRVDNPRLTARGAFRFRPLTRVIFDWRARVAPTAAVFSTLDAGPVIIVMAARAADERRADVLALERRGVIVETVEPHDLPAVLHRLAEREIVSLLLEGGPGLAAAFADAGLVDRVEVIATSCVLGQGVRWDSASVSDLLRRRRPRVTPLGQDNLLEFDVHGTH
jgi:diaminohydroxyphosphoribosylaminopyrimidine deaminase/5-amino-6-(5-phosphoribosylamino)uracil reductase